MIHITGYTLEPAFVRCGWTQLRQGALWLPSPHPCCDLLLLGPDGIGIDRRGGELGVAEPFLHQLKRDAYAHRLHAKAVAQPFGRGLRAREAGALHHGRHPAPGPQRRCAPLGTRLEGAQIVSEVEGIDHRIDD